MFPKKKVTENHFPCLVLLPDPTYATPRYPRIVAARFVGPNPEADKSAGYRHPIGGHAVTPFVFPGTL